MKKRGKAWQMGLLRSPIRLMTISAIVMTLVACRQEAKQKPSTYNVDLCSAWLRTERPFLKSIPKQALIGFEATKLQRHPYLEYCLKAGNWDGLVTLTFILHTDANGNPTALREERFDFYSLPPQRILSKHGRPDRIRYKGIALESSEIRNVLERIARGDRFDDLRQRVGKEVTSLREGAETADPWQKLIKENRGPPQLADNSLTNASTLTPSQKMYQVFDIPLNVRGQVQIVDVTQTNTITLHVAPVTYVSQMSVKVTGTLDGVGYLSVGGSAPEQLSSNVYWELYRGLSETNCVLEYWPETANSGRLTIEYLFQ